MIVAVDSGVLLHLIDPKVSARPDPETGQRPEDCEGRLQYLIDRISRAGGRLVIPTPVLAELLVKAGPASADWLSRLSGKKAIRVAPFDERAAVECAELAKGRLGRKPKGTRAEAKFDEQVIAIALVEGCDEIIADDDDIRKLAPSHLKVTRLAELALPPQDAQWDLPLPSGEPGNKA